MTFVIAVASHQSLLAPSPLRGEGWGEGVRASMAKTPNFIKAARKLRRTLTDAERFLWFRIRDRRLGGWKFKRQVPIDRYIVDFVCNEARIIVELDGGQHATQLAADATRTEALEARGYLVLRFWNNDVLKNLEGVVESIKLTLDQIRPDPPHPNPLPGGERESD